MGKRDFGALRELPSGRWQAKYRHPVSNRFVPAPDTFATRADGARWLATIQSDLARRSWIDPELGNLSVGAYAETWLSQRVLRPRTIELYKGLLKRNILPSLGAVALSDLSPSTVRAWHAELSRAGKPGPVTVAKAYRLLRTICETAVGDP